MGECAYINQSGDILHYMVALWNYWTSLLTSEAASHLLKMTSIWKLVIARPAIDWLSVIRMSDLSHKIGWIFFRVAVVSIQLYRCTTYWIKLDGNCTRMLQAILNNPGGNISQNSSCSIMNQRSWRISKLDETLPEEQGRTHKRRSPMDSFT